jgi:hypothetical protein
MSTTVPVQITAAAEESPTVVSMRPSFINPVPAHVTSDGRAVGELDAYLQWDGDDLLARVSLPDLPGHTMSAHCTIEATSPPVIRSLEVTIERR